MRLSRRLLLGSAVVIATTGAGLQGYIGVNTYAANNAVFSYTNCVTPSFVNGYARFQRPITDTGSGYMYAMPGARIRFVSNAKVINLLIRFNGLITRTDARNFVGAIYVDGALSETWQTPQPVNVVTAGRLNLANASAATHTYEIVWPYADGVEFGGVEVDAPYTVTLATALTGRKMLCYGDSITQGFYATDVRTTWPFLLAANKGFQCINMGYGGRSTTAADGTVIGNISADLITVLMGTNDFLNQNALSSYQSALTSTLQNIHAINPTIPVYVSAPIYNAASLTIPLSSYQAIPGAVIASLGYSQLIGVDQSTLITNPSTQMSPDGTHPNDTGHAQMAAGWGAVIT